MPALAVIELSKDVMFVVDPQPYVSEGINYVSGITIIGEKMDAGRSYPVVVRSVEAVNCKTNQWKTGHLWFYTANGTPVDERDNTTGWATVKPGTKGMRVVAAACGHATAQGFPPMPFKVLVSTYVKYRASK